MAAELLIRTYDPSGKYTCEFFTHFPGIKSVYLIIACTDSPQSMHLLITLKNELIRVISQIDASFTKAPVQHDCNDDDLFLCGLFLNPATTKQFIIVSDGVSSDLNAQLFSWKDGVLPIFKRNTYRPLPKPFDEPNAAFWDKDISETIPLVLGEIGIGDNDFKLFISYKRTETSALAEQLYDTLSHNGFDVFLDRFSVEPGIKFQKRLYQELADKAMVILLESPKYLESDWVKLEILFAKEFKLGVLAININDSNKTELIDDEYRLFLREPEMADSKAIPTKLGELVGNIKQAHAFALYRKRNYLKADIIKSLSSLGILSQIDECGFIHATDTNRNQVYKIWTTARPPMINDYYYSDSNYPNSKKLIVGPKFQESIRETHNGWLSLKSSIQFISEPEIIKMSNDISYGTI